MAKKQSNEYINSANQIPPDPNAKKKVFRSVRFKADTETLIIRTEIGYDLIFKLDPQIRVNPYEPGKNGTPEFQANVLWKLTGVRPKANAKKVSEIEELIKNRSYVPMELDFDILQLGFVYSNNRDPNNHRWWIEALKAGNKMGEWDSKFSEYPLQIKSDAPIGTRSWFDGIFHGRFTYSKDFVETVIEEKPGHIYIKGNGKGRLGDVKGDVPEGFTHLRLRFDIRKDIWIGEFLDENMQFVKTIAPVMAKNVKSDARFRGYITIDPQNPGRPKVSGMILRDDIVAIDTSTNIIIIKGKV